MIDMAHVVALLICVPLVFAVLIAIIPDDKIRGIIVYIGGITVMAGALYAAYLWLFKLSKAANNTFIEFDLPFNKYFNYATLIGDVVLMVVIIFLSFKHKKHIICLLSLIQTAVVCWVEFKGPKVEECVSMRFDNLTMIMVLIIGIIGSLIGIYAVGYMRGYHVHHKEFKDRRSFFFAMIFVFYAAMFGLVTTQNIMWLEFFWETTSVCSFLLIGYTRTEEAITNCFRALWMNLLGGLGFAVVIIISAYKFDTFNLHDIINGNALTSKYGLICLAALAFAAVSKTALFPFSKWLLGAMVAPTPSSALLHSATMVKAGVYLLIRMSPVMGDTRVGTVISIIGGFTFFASSLLAISQSDGKKVLAYSTISNLGLMVACTGVGNSETMWAAIFLMVFHAVSKSMCFQSVGAIENSTGSRDIEDMQGLMCRLPKLALVLLIGMAGMYLAPFGMLISKWAALKSVVDSDVVFLVLFIAFGSASTMFYWTKWMTKIVGNSEEREKDVTQSNEYISMFVHALIAVCVVASLPIISKKLVLPYIVNATILKFGDITVNPNMYKQFYTELAPLNEGNLKVMVIMIAAVIIVPLFMYFISRGATSKNVVGYMNGINTGDNRHFVDSFGNEKELHVSNWYMEEFFGEKKIFVPAVLIGVILCVILIGVSLYGLGGVR